MGLALLLVGLSAGCGPKVHKELVKVRPAKLGPLADDPALFEPDRSAALGSLKKAINQSLTYLDRLPPQREVRLGSAKTTVQGLAWSLTETLRLLDRHGLSDQFFKSLKADFLFYSAADPVLFTGYYEPLLEGREVPDESHTQPLFAPPDDLISLNLADFGLEPKIIRGRLKGRRLVPYHNRAEIDGGALRGRNLELAWVDPVEAFFLHIQGSGRVRFPDGRLLQVNYADQNGHPYVSLGKVMIQRGLLNRKEMSLQSIKAYLRSHPEEVGELLASNPSYVFFRLVEEGPLGALAVPLTPGRSMAVDRRLFPDGALCLVQTRLPLVKDGRISGWADRSRLFLIQDTGGAIRGLGRADLFFGYGPKAEVAAGHLKENGRLFVIVHKKVVKP